MSDFSAVAVIIALLLVDVFVYLYLERWFEERVDTIVTGVIRGVPVPIEHRWMLLQTRLVFLAAILILMQGMGSLGMLLLGRSVSTEEVALFAYLGSFFAFTAVVGWLLVIPFWFFRLARLLRQAEAD
jgi:hypothetical protein